MIIFFIKIIEYIIYFNWFKLIYQFININRCSSVGINVISIVWIFGCRWFGCIGFYVGWTVEFTWVVEMFRSHIAVRFTNLIYWCVILVWMSYILRIIKMFCNAVVKFIIIVWVGLGHKLMTCLKSVWLFFNLVKWNTFILIYMIIVLHSLICLVQMFIYIFFAFIFITLTLNFIIIITFNMIIT